MNILIKHQSFVYTQLNEKQFSFAYVRSLNVKTVLSQTIQFSISTQFTSGYPTDQTQSCATTPGQSGLGNDGNKKTPQSPKLQLHHQIVMNRTFIGGVLPLCRDAVSVFSQPQLTGMCMCV